MDDPCTNRMVPFFCGVTAGFSQMNSFTSPLRVQCSFPVMAISAGWFMAWVPFCLED